MKEEYRLESYQLSSISEEDLSKYLLGVEKILLRSITRDILVEYKEYLSNRDLLDRTHFALKRSLQNSDYLIIVQHNDVSLFCISRFEYFNPHKPYKGLVPALIVCDGCDSKICFKLFRELKRIARETDCKWYAMSHRIAPFKYNFQYIDL
jgi:hypothetical protein